MGIKKYRPLTPSQRYRTVSDFAEITTDKPEKSLLEPIRKKHNVDKLSEFAQANLTRAHFNRPEHIAETLVKYFQLNLSFHISPSVPPPAPQPIAPFPSWEVPFVLLARSG